MLGCPHKGHSVRSGRREIMIMIEGLPWGEARLVKMDASKQKLMKKG